MAKMWAGRTAGETAALADELNSSIGVDGRMYAQDIKGSAAHARMLSKQGIISEEEKDQIITGLEGILKDLSSGALAIDQTAEDIHMFVEAELTKRIGDAGKKVHTARSRNDQVALDDRMYLKDSVDELCAFTEKLIQTIADIAERESSVIMPGYTHLQRAQPILFSHQILAYAFMFERDIDRMKDCKKRMNVSPIGSCALAGTTYDTDRDFEAELLGFDKPCLNSIDGVSDRDFVVELLADLSILQMHLSRFAEELVLWSSWEFRFIELSDAYTTGSSIMPQKKNSDMAELIRGKTGRVYGDLITMLTVLKGLPLAYNKDMQEDKEAVFDAVDTVKLCLQVMEPMLAGMKVHADRMLRAAGEGFINATDLADYLTRKGMPFRDSYKITGSIVNYCINNGLILENVPLEKYREYSTLIDKDVYEAIDLMTCVKSRISKGGTSPESVSEQIKYLIERA
ncbi:MAG: argininosuccinate lyase [Lachnospiraceae bacterium]|nr:argininosuccinate lyase [Lachnospiraceae bacterium]